MWALLTHVLRVQHEGVRRATQTQRRKRWSRHVASDKSIDTRYSSHDVLTPRFSA